MKRKDIEIIADTCLEFTQKVCDLQDVIKKDELLKRLKGITRNYTIESDDTISVDFKSMLFTFHKTTLNGDYWELCGNASYYTFDADGCWLDTYDVEL